MSAAWVAGTVRARALARRRLGRAGARALAASPGLDAALAVLAASPYRRGVRPGQTLGQAQAGVSSTSLWHLRVAAGWLPRAGAQSARVLAGSWEIANVAGVLSPRTAGTAVPPYELGTLGTAWSQVRRASTPDAIRGALAGSAWGDPDSADPDEIVGWLRLRWAQRVAGIPGGYLWGAGLAAILAARELFVAGRRPAARHWPASLLGRGWQQAGSIGELADRLPRIAAWALREIENPRSLWQAEARWWARVERDALAGRARFRPGSHRDAVASMVLVTVDDWLVRAALEIAARGGRSVEAFDALAWEAVDALA